MKTNGATREQVLRAALRQFARNGYAGTSVQEIVDAARVTKPTLYYYFENKAGLYQGLLDFAHDERLRLMREAAGRANLWPEKLVEVLTALFGFFKEHRDLMRLTFSSVFALPEELPPGVCGLEKARRNFGFMHALIKEGWTEGFLDRRFKTDELAMAFYGLLNIHVMCDVIERKGKLDRRVARRIVRLFLAGAGAKTK